MEALNPLPQRIALGTAVRAWPIPLIQAQAGRATTPLGNAAVAGTDITDEQTILAKHRRQELAQQDLFDKAAAPQRNQRPSSREQHGDSKNEKRSLRSAFQ